MATHLCIPGEEANGILSRFAAAQSAQALALQRSEYVDLLARMDWQAEHSEDMTVVRRALAMRDRIRVLQPWVDADRSLMNAAQSRQHGAIQL